VTHSAADEARSMCDFAHFNSSGRAGMVAARFLQFLPTHFNRRPKPERRFFFAPGARRRRSETENAPAPVGARGVALRDRSRTAV